MLRTTLGSTKYALLLGALAFSLAGCGSDGGDSGDGGDGGCPAEVVFDGRTYAEMRHEGRLPTVAKLGEARFTDCGDGHEDPDADARMRVDELRGVSPTAAVAVTLGDQLVLYVDAENADPCAVRYTYCR